VIANQFAVTFKNGSNMEFFWENHYKVFDEFDASPFCKFIMSDYLLETNNVIEIGCGNGRDGLEIAKKVAFYKGVDLSKSAIREASKRFVQAGIKTTKYQLSQENFSEIKLSHDFKGNLVIYSRFSLHSDTENSEDSLLSKITDYRFGKITVMIESRTIYDELFGKGKNVSKNAYVTDHYRRFIDPEEFKLKIQNNFNIEYFEVSKGFAKYKLEDPEVMRIIFTTRF
jgi:SAM-dependent methyltransferase